MKQHPIPQNILDIEFKLFTKFTVREFVYMALGIGFGGIFLYFYTKGQLPGIFAIPTFIASSAIGLFLGLVPINDQKADIFLRNYIWAITNPTQRVWKNEKLGEKNAITDKMEVTQGTISRNLEKPGQAKVIGGGIGSNQFIVGEKLAELDKEEQERLAKIDGVAGDIPLSTQKTQQERPDESLQKNQTETTKNVVAPIQNRIIISRETLSKFQSTAPSNNQTLGFQIANNTGELNKDAIVAVKNTTGGIIFAQKTNSNGQVSISQQLPAGNYQLVVQSQNKTYSNIELILDGKPFPIVKLILG